MGISESRRERLDWPVALGLDGEYEGRVPCAGGASMGGEGVSVIVWDRARGHRGPAYEGVNVQLIEQPPYSPELNPVERVFEHLRGEVEGQVYGTMAAKRRAIEAELEQLAAAPDTVKILAGWDWIRQSVNSLPSSNAVFQ